MRTERQPAVLSVVEGRTPNSPEVCVVTGSATTSAVRMPAESLPRAALLQLILGVRLCHVLGILARRSAAVATIGVSPEAWKRWRRRVGLCVVVGFAGVGAAAAGILLDNAGWIWTGAILIALVSVRRIRWMLHFWINLDYRPATGTIRVFRAHRRYDEEARRRFSRRFGVR